MTDKSLSATGAPAEFDGWAIGIIASVGAILSLVITGYIFGTNNNAFHLPIVGALYDEPQFASDGFIQSLRYFASGPWILLSGSDRFVDPYWLFLILDLISRILTFVGFLLCADLFGIRSRSDRVLFACLICLTSLLRGWSYAGDGGLFIGYFTHSEIANGLTLIALFFVVRRQISAAFAMNGSVFFANAFVAVWNAFPLCAIFAYNFARHPGLRSRLLRGALIGLAFFLIISLPILINIMSNPDILRKPTFDIVKFHEYYYPSHFIFHLIPWKEKAKILLVILFAMASFLRIGDETSRAFLLITTAYVVLYIVGIFLPSVTHSAIVINLHLLRSSTFFHLLAALGGSVLAIRWLRSADPVMSRCYGPALVLFMCTLRVVSLFAIVPVLASAVSRSRVFPAVWQLALRWRADYAAWVCVVLFVVAWTVAGRIESRDAEKDIAEWVVLGQWLRQNTPADAMVLIPPTADMQPFRQGNASAPLEDPANVPGATIFEYEARRRVWVDFKQGAAVMWMPSYHEVFWPRIKEVMSLSSHGDKIRYAQLHGIDYLVEFCGDHSTIDAPPQFTTGRLCLYTVPKRQQ